MPYTDIETCISGLKSIEQEAYDYRIVGNAGIIFKVEEGLRVTGEEGNCQNISFFNISLVMTKNED